MPAHPQFPDGNAAPLTCWMVTMSKPAARNRKGPNSQFKHRSPIARRLSRPSAFYRATIANKSTTNWSQAKSTCQTIWMMKEIDQMSLYSSNPKKRGKMSKKILAGKSGLIRECLFLRGKKSNEVHTPLSPLAMQFFLCQVISLIESPQMTINKLPPKVPGSRDSSKVLLHNFKDMALKSLAKAGQLHFRRYVLVVEAFPYSNEKESLC